MPVACLREFFQQFPVVKDGDLYSFAIGWREDAEGWDDVFFLGIERARNLMDGGASGGSFEVDAGGRSAHLDGVVAVCCAGGSGQSADRYMYRRRGGSHFHREGRSAGDRFVVCVDGSPKQVGGRIEVLRFSLYGRKRCEGEVCSVEQVAWLQRRKPEAFIVAVAPCYAVEGPGGGTVERDGLADRTGGTVDQLLLIVEYKQFYLADSVVTGLRSAVKIEFQLSFTGQTIPPTTCDREEQHGKE